MVLFQIAKPQINLYMADEPSEALDAENKLVLARLLQRMAAMLPSVEGTMIITTRDEATLAACDHVIELARAAQ